MLSHNSPVPSCYLPRYYSSLCYYCHCRSLYWPLSSRSYCYCCLAQIHWLKLILNAAIGLNCLQQLLNAVNAVISSLACVLQKCYQYYYLLHCHLVNEIGNDFNYEIQKKASEEKIGSQLMIMLTISGDGCCYLSQWMSLVFACIDATISNQGSSWKCLTQNAL